MASILILGASYGSLLATKLALAGHRVRLVCSAATAELINREGTVVRFPAKGSAGAVAVRSRELPGAIDAAAPGAVDPGAFDLAVLGMQESQYAEPSVLGLMRRIATARVPCLAIMNMPPLPYLRRLPQLDPELLQDCYDASDVWQAFDPSLVTLASPDPQAFRPVDEPKNVLVVGLPTNFKAARFDADGPTALLRRLAQDIEGARYMAGGEPMDLPVKLKVHDSPFVPLAKWPMLITGNYRCIRPTEMVSIQQAVHHDLDRSRGIYEWVSALCCRLGAARDDLVPFEKYALAAASLQKPSSAARALFGGATRIERVDRLVRRIADQLELRNEDFQDIVGLVDSRLQANRAAVGT
ncbi:MAG: hypothetical protein ACXWJJ_02500 [Ramlibacter sp.]